MDAENSCGMTIEGVEGIQRGNDFAKRKGTVKRTGEEAARLCKFGKKSDIKKRMVSP